MQCIIVSRGCRHKFLGFLERSGRDDAAFLDFKLGADISFDMGACAGLHLGPDINNVLRALGTHNRICILDFGVSVLLHPVIGCGLHRGRVGLRRHVVLLYVQVL